MGARPESVAVGGDSAGGNLATVVAQLGTAAGIRPAFQLLFYPVADLSKKHLSYKLFSSGFFLTEAQMDWYRGHYLQRDADAMDPRASPLLALDLKGMPPAYVATAVSIRFGMRVNNTPSGYARLVSPSSLAVTRNSCTVL